MKNNSYVIFEQSPVIRGSSIVLGYSEKYKEYATWRYYIDAGCYAGHYFDKKEDAIKDFIERSKE